MVGRAARRSRDRLDVGPAGQVELGAVEVEHLAAALAQALAQPVHERAGVAVGERRDGARRGRTAPLGDVGRRAAHQLHGGAVALLVRLAPRDQAVLVEHHGARIAELGGALGELEARPQVGDDRNVGAERAATAACPPGWFVRMQIASAWVWST